MLHKNVMQLCSNDFLLLFKWQSSMCAALSDKLLAISFSISPCAVILCVHSDQRGMKDTRSIEMMLEKRNAVMTS